MYNIAILVSGSTDSAGAWGLSLADQVASIPVQRDHCTYWLFFIPSKEEGDLEVKVGSNGLWLEDTGMLARKFHGLLMDSCIAPQKKELLDTAVPRLIIQRGMSMEQACQELGTMIDRGLSCC